MAIPLRPEGRSILATKIMKYEFSRQLIHLGGLVFVLLAQFTGRFTGSLIFFLIALGFFVYSEFISRNRESPGHIRKLALKLDREVGKPFIGAFWFYFALGLTFLIFPLEIATASGLILSIGDSLSTMVGIRYGEHKILGNKSLEGSVVFFLSSFLVTAWLLGSAVAFLGSISATLLELIPEAKGIRKWEKKGIVNDNWLIPLISGLVMYIAIVLAGL